MNDRVHELVQQSSIQPPGVVLILSMFCASVFASVSLAFFDLMLLVVSFSGACLGVRRGSKTRAPCW